MDLPPLTDEDRAHIARVMSGEFENDLIRRGDVIEMMRDLRLTPFSLQNPKTYQRALSDVQRGIGRLEARVIGRRPGCYGTTEGTPA